MLKRIFLYLLLVVTFPIASYYGLVRGAPAASVPLLCLCSYAMLTTAWPPMRRWRLTRIARTVATIAACVTLAAWIVSITASVCVPYAPARALGLAHGSLVLHSGVDFSGKPLRFRAQLTPITLRAQYSLPLRVWLTTWLAVTTKRRPAPRKAQGYGPNTLLAIEFSAPPWRKAVGSQRRALP